MHRHWIENYLSQPPWLSFQRLERDYDFPMNPDNERTSSLWMNPWTITIIGGLIVAIFGVIFAFWISNRDTPESPNRAITDPSPTGQTGSFEGTKFEFSLIAIECGRKELRDQNDNILATAQGEFCLASLRVRNAGREAGHPLGSVWRLFVDDRRFPVSRSYGEAFYENIFPGNSAEGLLVFDVPEGSDPTLLKLDELWGNVEIPL